MCQISFGLYLYVWMELDLYMLAFLQCFLRPVHVCMDGHIFLYVSFPPMFPQACTCIYGWTQICTCQLISSNVSSGLYMYIWMVIYFYMLAFLQCKYGWTQIWTFSSIFRLICIFNLMREDYLKLTRAVHRPQVVRHTNSLTITCGALYICFY